MYLLCVLLDDVRSSRSPLPPVGDGLRVQPEEEALAVAVHAALGLLHVRVLCKQIVGTGSPDGGNGGERLYYSRFGIRRLGAPIRVLYPYSG